VGAGAHIDAARRFLSAEAVLAIRKALPGDHSARSRLRGNFNGCEFEDGCLLSGLRIRGSFKSARFLGRADFRDSEFERRTRFDEVAFLGPTSFDKAAFGDQCVFRDARFADDSRFAGARFGAATRFERASFGDRCSFRGATFGTKPRFRGARFGNDMQFTKATFGDGAEFVGARFGQNSSFVVATFGAGCSFRGAYFEDRAMFIAARLGDGCDLRGAVFWGFTSFQRAVFEGDVSFRLVDFTGATDLGGVSVGGRLRLSEARFATADRIGPIDVRGTALLRGCLVEKDVTLDVAAPRLSLAGSRLLAGCRIAVSGELVLQNAALGPRCEIHGVSPSARLLTVEGADVGHLSIVGVGVSACQFAGAQNLHGLRLESGAQFATVPPGRWRGPRVAIAEEHALRWRAAEARAGRPSNRMPDFGEPSRSGWYPDICRPQIQLAGQPTADRRELARCYRALRKGREDSSDAPGASDLYYGEMEMRRLEPRPVGATFGRVVAWGGERLLLEAYRAVAGYGVRAGRPALCLVTALIGVGVILDWFDLISRVDGALTTPANFADCLLFTVRAALLLPSSPSLQADRWAQALQIALRIVGPTMIALIALGLRSRVKR